MIFCSCCSFCKHCPYSSSSLADSLPVCFSCHCSHLQRHVCLPLHISLLPSFHPTSPLLPRTPNLPNLLILFLPILAMSRPSCDLAPRPGSARLIERRPF